MRFGPVALLLNVALTAAQAQDAQQFTERGPRFLLASGTTASRIVRVDVARTPVLRRRLTLDLESVTLDEAIKRVAQDAGLELAYSTAVLPWNKIVSLKAEGITVAAALTELLVDADVDILFSKSGQAVLIRKSDSLKETVPAVGVVNGRVTEAKTGSPVPQAQVSVNGTGLTRVTTEDGRYSISVVPPGTRTITVRRLGYESLSRVVSVSDGATVTADFELVAATTRLAEIVTTVTGGQRRVEVGNTIATVNADSLVAVAPVMSFGDLLNGRAPGVLSLQEGGMSGRAGRIRIRGLNSALVSNDPIVVLDGVRIEATAGGEANRLFLYNAARTTAAGGFSGRLSDINPEEIASIEVVKGPSAATLYGTDAANGVIVITTKRGQPGKTRITGFVEQGTLSQTLDTEDNYPAAYYSFGRNTTTNAAQRCTLLQRAASSCVVDSLRRFSTFDDASTRPFRNGMREQYGVHFDGGIGATGATYFLSGETEREIGTAYMPPVDQAFLRQQRGTADLPDWQLRPNMFRRVNLRGNVSMPTSRRSTTTISTTFISNYERQPAGASLRTFPFAQTGYRDANDGWFSSVEGNARPAYLFARRSDDNVSRFIGSVTHNTTLNDWLTARTTLGTDLSTDSYGTLVRRGELPSVDFASVGRREVNELSVKRYSFDAGATAARKVSEVLQSKTSVGIQYNRRMQRGVYTGTCLNLPLGGETLAGCSSIGAPSEATFSTAVAGGYVEELLGWRDDLFVTGALRFDGGSAFGKDFSVATYPKASVSWVALSGDGSGGRDLPVLGSLRLRLAYGSSGVQPGPLDALDRIGVQTGLNASGTALVPVSGIVPGNALLKPERSTELEAGADLDALDNRVRVEVTVYRRRSTDALFRRAASSDVALTEGETVVANLGSVENRGLEVSVGADALRGPTVSAGATLTAAWNANELKKLGVGVTPRAPTGTLAQQEVGYPVNGLWGFYIESFADANGNGIIEIPEVTVSTAARFYGPNVPTREMTAAPYVGLWNDQLHVSGLLQYRGGFYRNNLRAVDACNLRFGGFCQAVNDPTTPLEEQARTVAAVQVGRTGPFIEESSFLLFRELSLAYTAPSIVAAKLRANRATLVLAARNVGMLWKANHVPFENAIVDPGSDTGAQMSDAPSPPKYWILRLNLSY